MRLAIVTGTSRGLGLAVAAACLRRDWHVLGIARSSAPGELAGERYRHLSADLADASSASGIEDAVRAATGGGCERLGLVDNAGLLEPVAPLHEADPRALAAAVAVNAAAPLWLMGIALRAAGAAGAPLRIVDVSSGAATDPYPGWAAYCSTKAALRMAGRVLAAELEEVPSLRGRDVALVSYAPHVVATAMQETIRAADPDRFPRRERFVQLHEQGRLVPPEAPAAEIAALLDADGLPPWSERRYRPPS